MKFTINTPQNGYQGWTGFLTDADGKRHGVSAWNGQAAYETKDQLIKAARRRIAEINAIAARREQVRSRLEAGVTGPL